MSKSRDRRGKKKQSSLPKQKSQPNYQPSGTRRFLRFLGKMLGTIFLYSRTLIVVVSIIAGAFFFYPRLLVDSEQYGGSGNPFSVSFVIRNGFVPLESVNVGIGICWIHAELNIGTYDSHGMINDCGDKPHATLFTPKEWKGHRLESDGIYTINLIDGFNEYFYSLMPSLIEYFKSADISIVISFQPWIVPIRMTKEYRFTAAPDSKGKVIWSHQTIDRP
jgi:hypothetical protein